MTATPHAIARMFHPTLHVADLDAAQEFYRRVFARNSRNLSEVMDATSDHASDYSIFTMVGDILLDTLSPRRYRTNGEQRYPDVDTGELKTTGWYVKNVASLYETLREHGIRVTNSRDIVLEGETAPKGPQPFHGHPDDTGIRYHFFEEFSFPLDPRTSASAGNELAGHRDPLGIIAGSHHTILSSQPYRAVTLLADLLGGTNLGAARDELLGVSGTLVQLAESTFLVGSAEPGGPADAAQPAPDAAHDRYYAITWQVADIDVAVAHLEQNGVAALHATQHGFTCLPETSLGVPWSFTSLPVSSLSDAAR